MANFILFYFIIFLIYKKIAVILIKRTRGVLNIQAEIIPIEPDPGNAGVGKRVNQKKPAVFILKLMNAICFILVFIKNRDFNNNNILV